ncbi:unnamed protein product [Adineta ricciae]|uniref:AB hydrolase-1 domain-containing protein n=1 Tax=Adineta ricciae TaxID=249248 RepID=A0A815RCZ1_ADIRI|nr:unnamed protein product [Adineta ricciae]CAF1533601.1 unnamed protein product [Adineta ricciae]
MSTVINYSINLLSLFVIVSSVSLSNIDDVNTRERYSPLVLTPQNYEVSPGINYEYIYVKGDENGITKATILFIHGFPSSFHSWRHQIGYFSRQGYDSLAPNLMGYGKTYSPLNRDEYKMKSMTEHLITLLNHLHVSHVIVVGHDWGTHLANRFVLYHPQQTLGVALISGGYSAPALFDLDKAIEASRETIGYEILGYWKFFDAEDAAEIIENNLDSFIDLAFASDSTLWKTDLAPVGKARNWLINGNRTTRGSYMTEEDYEIFRRYLAEGMQPKLNWYKAEIANIEWNVEKNLDPIIRQPVLLMGGTKDYVSLIAFLEGPNPYIVDLETIAVDTGHWVMEENPNAVNQELDKWIKRILSTR